MFENQYIDYAADMTILLAYYKCKDDWKDEAKKMEAAYGTMLEKHVGRRSRNPADREKYYPSDQIFQSVLDGSAVSARCGNPCSSGGKADGKRQ